MACDLNAEVLLAHTRAVHTCVPMDTLTFLENSKDRVKHVTQVKKLSSTPGPSHKGKH